jgi:hypothetical protein
MGILSDIVFYCDIGIDLILICDGWEIHTERY